VAVAVSTDRAAHHDKVRSVLLRLVKDPALADDLLQETLLRAIRTSSPLRGDASPDTWLTAIALNVTRDHFRSSRRIPPFASLDEAAELPAGSRPDRELLQREMSDCILAQVAQLPERQRDALLLHQLAGFSHREIAERLGISEGCARVTLHRS
jgi:RNA polymerase sigma-70 factor (ECF subfamily)